MATKRKKKAPPAVDVVKVESDLAPERELLESQLAVLHQMPLETSEHAEIFGELIKDIRARADAHEAQRKEVKAPAIELGKRIDALFKPLKDLYAAMDKAATERLTAFLAARRDSNLQALEAVASGSRDADTLARAHESAETPTGLAETESITFEVVDASQIPRQFMCLDESLARAWVKHKRASGAEHEIPGVKVIVAVNLKRTGTRRD